MKIYNPGENEVRALDDVSLQIKQGEFVAIIGQSGSGKSTFMNILGCLDIPTSGNYYLNGKDVSGLSDDEVYKHTEWRYMTQCGIIETLGTIAVKIKAMIEG